MNNMHTPILKHIRLYILSVFGISPAFFSFIA